MGLGDLSPRALPAELVEDELPGGWGRPGAGAGEGAGARHDEEGPDYRFEGLWEDLPQARMREGVDLLIAHFGAEDAKRFIDTLTRARVKQLAFNGTDSAFRAAQEYAPQVATAARQVGAWAKTNPVVLGGVIGSVASAALSFVHHRKRMNESGG